uniref:Uncharacterized protein n=1 Tax=Oryza nivara TaxID=4536 RepID=A0A0E0J0V1_ORYNI
MAAAADLAVGFFHLPPLPATAEGPPAAADPLPPPCRNGEGPPAAGRRSSQWIRVRAHRIRAWARRIGRPGAQQRRFLSSLLRDRQRRGVAVAADLGTGRGDA